MIKKFNPRDGESFLAGVASIANLPGLLPSFKQLQIPIDTRTDAEKLQGDFQKISEDFSKAFERESSNIL